jgi:hypothetical protein
MLKLPNPNQEPKGAKYLFFLLRLAQSLQGIFNGMSSIGEPFSLDLRVYPGQEVLVESYACLDFPDQLPTPKYLIIPQSI